MNETTFLLEPAIAQNTRNVSKGIVFLFAISAGSLLLAPLRMPASYSVIADSISESAGQGIEGAWLARLGLLTFGFAVIWLATALRRIVGRSTFYLHLVFGICMAAAAAFSSKPWMPSMPFDTVEDFLHSAAATIMGFAFAMGALSMLFQRAPDDTASRAFDIFALMAATIIPLSMLAWPDAEGLVQRFMFLIAYVWYIKETRMLAKIR